MEEFSLPEDITAHNDEELDALLDGAINAFDAMSRSSTVTTDDLARLRELATEVENIRAEKAERIAAAQQAATTAETTEPAAVEPLTEAEPAKETATATAVVKNRALDLSRIRAHQPRALPSDPNPRPEITASVDVPDYEPGQALAMADVTEDIIRRAKALKPAGGAGAARRERRPPFGWVHLPGRPAGKATEALALAAWGASLLGQGCAWWCRAVVGRTGLTPGRCRRRLHRIRARRGPARRWGTSFRPGWRSGRRSRCG